MRALLALLAVLILTVPAAADEGPQPRLRTTQLAIETVTGRHVFTVEMALSPEQQSRGLMFRREMPADEGMLFDFGREQPLGFWMRNTLISLDMIFIGADGRVVSIAERTTPLSEAVVPSRAPARAVLEVIAGTARRIGLRPGDQIRNVIFGNGP